ncbi:MAG: serine/threonine-protein kinase [Verrucomicrobiaceae bacterium]|nr:MAG: serine/threonine-protein kinase [Verrucomicrobiaceae bacterium]
MATVEKPVTLNKVTHQEHHLEVGHRLTSSSKTYYRIVQQLGGGGNSVVYLVQALGGPHRGVLFALKLFVRVNDATRLGRFQREVSFLKKCDHPSIMRVFDDGQHYVSTGTESQSYPFVVVEYLPQTLRDALRGGLTIAGKLSFTLELLSGLSYLSKQNPAIVHRDIKPENIFVRGRSCVLGDFGLMKTVEPTSGAAVEPNDVEFFIDSTGPRLPRFYRTPDLVDYCRSKGEITPKSDVFQLGLTVAEMFTGEVPLEPVHKILEPVVVVPLQPFGGSQAAAIGSQINQMLTVSSEMRPHAEDLLDPWEGIFLEVVKLSHQLEGRVF